MADTTSVKNTASPEVSFEKDIVPLFRPMDVECMNGKSIFLIDYDFMTQPGNAQNVIDRLKPAVPPDPPDPSRMPLGGPYWSDESIQLFQDWMDGGMKA